ncbi:MAG TPA: response regulator [Polyangia bacterium]|nr:response regulator [Polyangia bacterium]
MAHGHILVVDDDDDARAGVVEILEHAQFQVRAARNGREALAELEAGLRPNLILLDLNMPVMDGWEFARLAAADPALADIPICMISGAERSVGIPPQVVAVLRKPLEMTRLLSVVYQYC